ncbi:MAG: 2-oxoacid:acceptor oxidoreductase family protein [Bacillota bacterium]|nr:2-oxoacid:acceptor oxidoreductase family protein [Bacillota bacterium]
MRYEFRLSGQGGQGVILAGIILAEAAIFDGLNAVQTQSYGPESRGGASKAEVVVSDTDIDYPKVTVPDAVLVLSQEAHEAYGRKVGPGAVLVADEEHVEGPWPEGARVVRVPIARLALEVTGRELTTNIVALGVLTRATGIVSAAAVERAVRARVPRGTEELNMKAFAAGMAAVRMSDEVS